jgi:hypothetical protein
MTQGGQASRISRNNGAVRRKNELEGNECMPLLSLKTRYFAATQQMITSVTAPSGDAFVLLVGANPVALVPEQRNFVVEFIVGS